MIVDDLAGRGTDALTGLTPSSRFRIHAAGVLALLALVLVAYLYVGSVAAPAPATEEARRPQAPAFTAPSFGEEEISLADYRGRPVVLNFWASWCPPCRAEAPQLERVWQAYRDRGVVFLGVDIRDSEVDARVYLREFGVTYANLRDPSNAIAVGYGVSGIPATFFIDREGRVASRWLGPVSEQQIAARVEELVR